MNEVVKDRRLAIAFGGAIFFFFGIVMIIAAGFLIKKEVALQDHGSESIGKVVKVIEKVIRRDGRTEYAYYPVVSYEVDGKHYTLESSIGSNPSMYDVGDEVEVLYLPENISSAEIKSKMNLVFPLIFLMLGFVASGGGVMVIKYRHKFRRVGERQFVYETKES